MKKPSHKTLIDAVRSGDCDVVAKVIAAGADINAKDGAALLDAVTEGEPVIVDLLLDAGADVHVNDDWPLRLSASYGDIAITARLLQAGADVHAVNGHALISAASNGHLQVVGLLLNAGADVHAGNDWALNAACKHGHVDVVIRLLAAGADLNAADGEPLQNALDGGHEEVMSILLAAGADMSNNLLLKVALKKQNVLLVKALLAAGACAKAAFPDWPTHDAELLAQHDEWQRPLVIAQLELGAWSIESLVDVCKDADTVDLVMKHHPRSIDLLPTLPAALQLQAMDSIVGVPVAIN